MDRSKKRRRKKRRKRKKRTRRNSLHLLITQSNLITKRHRLRHLRIKSLYLLPYYKGRLKPFRVSLIKRL
jgi:hypothetical protein